jgi:hypothetical protein
MKPKWQKARILRQVYWPEVVGHEIWIDGNSRGTYTLTSIKTGSFETHENYKSNISGVMWPTDELELLARAETDFTNVVVMTSWDDFLADCRKSS